MRQRAARYTTLDGLSSERDTIPVCGDLMSIDGRKLTEEQWYWRIIAFGAAWLILGGFV